MKKSEIVFINNWNTHACITTRGEIHLFLHGSYFTKDQFIKSKEGCWDTGDYKSTINLFKELNQYYMDQYL